MDLKQDIFDQVASARTGRKTVNEATNCIFDFIEPIITNETNTSTISKEDILKKIIDNAKTELTEDNYWTFRGMLVEFSKKI